MFAFSGLPANIQLDIDGDRETERIYSLFSTYMTKLIKMQGQTSAWRLFQNACARYCDCCVYICRSTPCFPSQRPVEVNPCTTGPSRRSTPASSSMTPRRPTKPWNWSFQLCRPWSSSTPSTNVTSLKRQRSAASKFACVFVLSLCVWACEYKHFCKTGCTCFTH